MTELDHFENEVKTLLRSQKHTERSLLYTGNGAGLAAVSAMLVSDQATKWAPVLIWSGWLFFAGLIAAALIVFSNGWGLSAGLRAIRLARKARRGEAAADPSLHLALANWWSRVEGTFSILSALIFLAGVVLPLVAVSAAK